MKYTAILELHVEADDEEQASTIIQQMLDRLRRQRRLTDWGYAIAPENGLPVPVDGLVSEMDEAA